MNLTALGIGAIIGTGIFVLTGTVAAQNAGPAVILSFVLAGIASVFAALCYSEFASLVPMAGSAYTYGYATMGELIAWIIGWDLIWSMPSARLRWRWGGRVTWFHFCGVWGSLYRTALSAARGTELVDIPAALAGALKIKAGWTVFTLSLAGQIKAGGGDASALTHATAIFNLPAVIIIFVVTTLLVIGIKESAAFTT